MKTWSSPAGAVWGKTAPAMDQWMPLVRHLDDAYAVGVFVWDQWLPATVRARVGREFPGGDAEARSLYLFLCGCHDVGKAQFVFALKARKVGMGRLVDAMVREGLVLPQRLSTTTVTQHWTVGYLAAVDWALRRYALPRTVSRGLFSPIGVHHGVGPDAMERNRVAAELEREHDDHQLRAWTEVRDEILDEMALRSGLDQYASGWSDLSLSAPAQSLLSGAVVVADWLASDSDRFPYEDVRSSTERAATAVSEWDLPHPWQAAPHDGDTDGIFQRRFGRVVGAVRPIQVAAVAAARRAEVPPLLVIEAGTGEGKTEAALLAAEVLAERFGSGGVLVALPTQATSDAMIGRVRAWVEALPDLGRTSMYLAHGKAALNEDFQALVRAGHFHGVEDEFTSGAESRAVVTSWLRGRRTGLLANFVVGTIDQVLFGALNARHLPLRQLGLAGKVVIIDEAHAADDYMRVYLRRILEWLGAFGSPVVLLSATLPPAVRDSLTAAYAGGAGLTATPSDRHDTYPRITLVAEPTSQQAVAPGGHVTRKVEVEILDDDASDEAVLRALADGACVAVLSNTVQRAQDTFERLRARTDAECLLVHSRMIAPDRIARERRIRDLLGPPGSGQKRPRGLLVCGTQVLEASIDYDVDLMVTDLAPLDLIIQRVGRLHRHVRGAGETDRPEGYRHPRLILTGVALTAAGPPVLADGSQKVYGVAALLRASAVLLPYLTSPRPLSLPTDVPRLVREAYDPALAAPPGWEAAWTAAEKAAARDRRARETSARTFAISQPDDVDTPAEFSLARADEPDDSAGQAQVRDAEETLEVVVVRRVDGDLYPIPAAGSHQSSLLPTDLGPPVDEVARAIAACTLRLPSWLTSSRMDAFINELETQGGHLSGWQQSPWLRGELVLILDDRASALSTTIAGWRLVYDQELGLRVNKEERDDV